MVFALIRSKNWNQINTKTTRQWATPFHCVPESMHPKYMYSFIDLIHMQTVLITDICSIFNCFAHHQFYTTFLSLEPIAKNATKVQLEHFLWSFFFSIFLDFEAQHCCVHKSKLFYFFLACFIYFYALRTTTTV